MKISSFVSSVLKLASIGAPFILYLTNSGDFQLYDNMLRLDFHANTAFVFLIR